MSILAGLNANQRRAVDWGGGPLLVLAGPGSGKTRVLTLRVARLLRSSADESFRVLGLTFTCEAATEMRTRVNGIVGPDLQDRALLTTFHSFCGDVLRQHGSHVGVRPDFTILAQQAEREAVLRDAVHNLHSRGRALDGSAAGQLAMLDKLLGEFVPGDSAAARCGDHDTGESVADLYREYRRQLLAQNSIDYPSLLFLTFELLNARPAVACQLRTVYRHLCVDEFQDTNLAQYRILRLIAGDKPKNLFVVADDDQIIYQWTGASPERLDALRTDFDMSVLQPPTNYRCPPEVIDLANKLIRCNLARSPGKQSLVAAKQPGGRKAVRVRCFDTMAEELAWVAADIAGRGLNDHGKCVVLARTKKALEEAARALGEAGVKAVLHVRKDEFESSQFRWLHSVLRLANARSDPEQLRRVCAAFYDMEGLSIRPEWVTAAGASNGSDYLNGWLQTTLGRGDLKPGTRSFLGRSRRTLSGVGFLGFVGAALTWFEVASRRPQLKVSGGGEDYYDERRAWQELQSATLAKYGTEQVTLNLFLQEFDLSPKTPPVPPEAVRCFTIHTAKGMEFPHVYLVGLVEDMLPSYHSVKKGDASAEVQEERRNCFVAITRTQESLTLTHHQKQDRWSRRPSRFLAEMGLQS